MQFQGRHPTSGDVHGWWGTGGLGSPQPFAEVPAFGMTRAMLCAIEGELESQHELFRLPKDEWFVGRPVRALDRVLLMTNQRLLAYRPDRAVQSKFAPPILDWQLPLMKGEPIPLHVNVAELLDGWLVSLFYYDGREFEGFESLTSPWEQVDFIDVDGKSTVVGEQREIRGQHVSFVGLVSVPVASWWVSPPL